MPGSGRRSGGRPLVGGRLLVGSGLLVGSRLLVAGALLAAAACGHPDQDAATRREAVLMELRRMNDEVSPRSSMAAVSADTKRTANVTPLDASKLGVVRDSAAYRLFLHRCNGCHAAPDPTMHRATEWAAVLSAMRYTMQHAGLLPPTDEEWRSMLEFLRAHARH